MTDSVRKPPLPQINCHACSLSRLCLPASLSESEVAELDRIVRRNRPLHKGDHLFRAGEAMRQVFALRSGALKTYLLESNGEQQVTGFVLPGELIGLDAIGAATFRGFALALETSMVCAIDLEQLEDLSGRIPGLRHQLLHILSQGIHGEHEHIRCNRERAEQRLAQFLLGLSVRYQQRGLQQDRFSLPMTRGDIGNYLDLTLETISRLFARFVQNGLIECQGREVRLLDRAALCRLSGVEA
ncbi:fumarate/nitrate reduction transcriptional regulator Fnr [Pseudomonas citronellolis]|uniref:fumarate/nitrate reduction transcriptional regulator Fnr n=1 Tax=Pseudomonas citronellolis TaxID=53408 RepID=UPI0023E37256|nr:fumarate/nitrate reduction transcriptional regulator Fnr [Pseudomonas citronellolis]MDF3933683.1 fumarate/nitrate reduction transcriptional regulator Fnr [Pseudomonas citronellolis]